jgi:hypothetical protein
LEMLAVCILYTIDHGNFLLAHVVSNCHAHWTIKECECAWFRTIESCSPSKECPVLMNILISLKVSYRNQKIRRSFFIDKTCSRVHSHSPHTPILIDVFVRQVLSPLRRAEAVISRRSRYLTHHKTESFVSQCDLKLHDFRFQSIFDQPCDLSFANIVEMIAESDPIFIPDILRSIFFVMLDYELMNPVFIRREHISSTASRSFKVSISDRHSERLHC